MTIISQTLKQLGKNFAPHSGTTHGMFLQNIIWVSVKLRALDLAQRSSSSSISGGGASFKPIKHI